MSKNVLVPVADGTEELEAVAIIDVLRRAEAKVTVASVSGSHQITASRGMVLVADALLEDCQDQEYDLIVLPGGIPGADHLRDSDDLTAMLKRQVESERLYGAICASPAVVLEHHGLLNGRRATAHPFIAAELSNQDAVHQSVVTDGNCVTSQGAGTAVDFALELVEQLFGKQKQIEVAKGMALSPPE
jgi:4-methyl-5(b-hydroxyethyl)-thiazole monophosphate biosynthesis